MGLPYQKLRCRESQSLASGPTYVCVCVSPVLLVGQQGRRGRAVFSALPARAICVHLAGAPPGSLLLVGLPELPWTGLEAPRGLSA